MWFTRGTSRRSAPLDLAVRRERVGPAIRERRDLAPGGRDEAQVQLCPHDPLPLATIQITDTGTGKTFFNQPTFMGLVTGQTGYPFLLPAPRLIAPNTNIQYNVTNLASAARNFYLTMIGARLYYANQ